jgi:hypothetical protein
MRSLPIMLVVALAIAPAAVSAQRGGGGRSAPNQGRSFNMSNDIPSQAAHGNNGSYWGGGFWGPFAVGAATAAVMGQVIHANQTYTSDHVSTGSPGAPFLSNYGLQQVPCGPSGLVVIYGPNFGVICANPNGLVAAGNYAVNVDNLTIQSQ